MIIKLPFSPYDLQINRVHKLEEISKESEFVNITDRNYTKIFCIGYGKTGTTSLQKLLIKFGFKLGNQSVAEILAEDWAIERRSERIINYCHTAEAFQDIPFMYPELFKELDKSFPNSKFILTVRDNEDQWFDSLIRFHSKKFSTVQDSPPSEKDKKNALYLYKGWIYDVSRFFWDYPEIPLYDPKNYKKKYLDHIIEVNEYFKCRPNDFIEINLSKQDDFYRLCDFLSIETNISNFPWENKT
jgi:hypothetical protein